jgi:hypothetical protein
MTHCEPLIIEDYVRLFRHSKSFIRRSFVLQSIYRLKSYIFVNNNCPIDTVFGFDNSDMRECRRKFASYEDNQIDMTANSATTRLNHVSVNLDASPPASRISAAKIPQRKVVTKNESSRKIDGYASCKLNLHNAQNVRAMNVKIHEKVRKSLNSHKCCQCGKGFLNVPFAGKQGASKCSKPLRYYCDTTTIILRNHCDMFGGG